LDQNDSIFFIFIAGTLFITIFVSALILFLIQYKRRQVRFYTEKLEIQHQYDTQLLQTKLEVQEQSFKYFSEEIHDNAGQLLSSVKHQLYNIKTETHEEHTIQRVTETTELLSRAINDLRNISHTLNNSFIAKAGLIDAIEKELRYIYSAKGLTVQLHVSGDKYNLSHEQELLIFRIVQESMANAIKHASATAIDIYLDYKIHLLVVTIQDNGTGFNTNEIKSDGIGLNNMQVRAAMLKGRLKVNSQKQKGTTIHLEIDTLKDQDQ